MKSLYAYRRGVLLGVAGILLISRPCYANIGLPMVFPSLMFMVVGLIPIVYIETFVLHRRLPLSMKELHFPVGRANVFSTFVGIPIAWLALVLIEMFTGGGQAFGLGSIWEIIIAVTWQAPWLVPYYGESSWMIFFAFLVLTVPFYFTSVWIEYRFLRRIFKEVDRKALLRAEYWAHLFSYLLLIVIDGGFFLFSS